MIATECVDEDLYFTEINASRNVPSMRSVKRRCLSLEASDETTSRGRSFLETKWESNITSGRRRKTHSSPVSSYIFFFLSFLSNPIRDHA